MPAMSAGLRAGWWRRIIDGARTNPARALVWLLGVAFVARLAARLPGGEASLLENSYSLYLDVAANLVSGEGLCVAPGEGCALRMPGYPLLLAPFVASGGLFPGLVMAQAALGAALVWVTWRIGHDLFDARVGLVAAALAALSPYAVRHDTAIQDTVLVNLLVAVTLWLLWRTRHDGRRLACLAAGFALAAVVLTTARLALLVPAVLVWAALASGPTWQVRLRSVLLIALPVVVGLASWVGRNASIVGAPVMTTESGESLWIANNRWAMAHYPARSIDLSVTASYAALDPMAREAFLRVASDEVARDRLLRDWALAEMAAHPWRTIRNGARKIRVAISAELSPARGALVQAGYALLFLPVHVLAVVGWFRARGAWRTHALLPAVCLAFAATTAVFWAHTSHKSFLDAPLFVYAVAACVPGASRSVS